VFEYGIDELFPIWTSLPYFYERFKKGGLTHGKKNMCSVWKGKRCIWWKNMQ
jgi:hypothetical protein